MYFVKFRCFYSYEDYHKKYSKNFKKGVDKGAAVWYNNKAVANEGNTKELNTTIWKVLYS